MPGPDDRPRAIPGSVRNRWLGTAGSALVAAGSLGAGALPARDPYAAIPLVGPLRGVPGLAVALVFAGLVLLVVAWLRLGGRLRRAPEVRIPRAAVGAVTGGAVGAVTRGAVGAVLGGSLPGPAGAVPIRELTITLAWWVAPLLAVPPLFSRDAYSYLAQGAMVGRGLDAYLLGPSALGGPLAADVPPIWQDTPAPYGPIALATAAAVVSLVDERTVPALLGMRLAALAALGLVVRHLPEIARRSGVEPGRALWLGVLNPLVLIHLVGGIHNDALMIGLLVTGLVLVLRRWWVPGVAVLTMAALVKAPAAIALLTVVPLWAARYGGRWGLVRAGAGTAAVAAGTTVAVTGFLGLGYGWVSALSTPMVVRNGLSISTNIGLLVGWLPDRLGLAEVDQTIAATRVVGLLAAVAVIGYGLWRGSQLGPVTVLGLALLSLVVLGPVVHPWYLAWGIVVLAAGTERRWLRSSLIVTSAALTFVLQPMGSSPEPADVLGAFGGAALALLLVRARGPLAGTVPAPLVVPVRAARPPMAGGSSVPVGEGLRG